jgi:hypothetical protein
MMSVLLDAHYHVDYYVDDHVDCLADFFIGHSMGFARSTTKGWM